MALLSNLNVVTGIIGGVLVINIILFIIAVKAKLDWKVTRAIIVVFIGLFIWSLIRFFNRLDVVNIYDYLTLIFNGGLVITGYVTSKHIGK